MGDTKRIKGKLQITGQFWDAEGDRLWGAFDMGWGNAFWARIKSEAIIRAAVSIQPPIWTMLKIEHSKETSFTKFIERRFRERRAPVEYLVVRTKSTASEGDIDSWFFIHGLGPSTVADKSARYSDDKPEVIEPNRLGQELKRLFAVEMHLSTPRTRRWSASKATKHALCLFRMQHLIKLAREGKDHELTEGVPTMADFEVRLAKYIKHDRPLIFSLEIEQIRAFLIGTGMIDDWEIEIVIKKLLEYDKRWERVDIHKGLPSAGAEIDKEDGRFLVREGKTSSLSIRLKKLTEEELAWETVPHPETKAEEEHLE